MEIAPKRPPRERPRGDPRRCPKQGTQNLLPYEAKSQFLGIRQPPRSRPDPERPLPLPSQRLLSKSSTPVYNVQRCEALPVIRHPVALVPPPGGSPGGGVGEEAGGWRGEVVGGGRQGVGVAADRGGGENVDGMFLWNAVRLDREGRRMCSDSQHSEHCESSGFSPQRRGRQPPCATAP